MSKACKSKQSKDKKPKPGRWRCGKCGVVAGKSRQLCKPKKIKAKE